MQKFHFHSVATDGDFADEEGSDYADIECARLVAITGIRDILSEQVSNGRLDLRGYVEIASSTGHLLETIGYRDAITIAHL